MFKDFDVPDKSIRKNASATARWNGQYAEGVEMISGWQDPVVLAPNTSDLANTCLVETQTVAENCFLIGKYHLAR